MTDEEKASIRDLLKTADIYLSERQTNILCRAFELSITKGYEQGLAEGRKEVREHETTCVNRLHFIEKENAVLKTEYRQTEKDYAELKVIAANRKAFIDWCAEHHEEVLKEYNGFIE